MTSTTPRPRPTPQQRIVDRANKAIAAIVALRDVCKPKTLDTEDQERLIETMNDAVALIGVAFEGNVKSAFELGAK